MPLKLVRLLCQFNRALAAFIAAFTLLDLAKETAQVIWPDPHDVFAALTSWGSLARPVMDVILSSLTVVVFTYALRLLNRFNAEDARKLIRLLFVIAPLRFIAYIFAGLSPYGELWSSLLNGSFFIKRTNDIDSIMNSTYLATKLYNVVNVFTIHIDCASAVTYALLLMAVTQFLRERDELRDDLSTVI